MNKPGARPHGTLASYRAGCGCTACRAANAAKARHRRRMLAYGRWRPFTDAEPVRAHVRRLQAAGLGLERIAGLAGVPARTVTTLIYGAPAQGYRPTRRIRPHTAQALLAVRLADLPAAGWVPAVGTQRRLQALAAIGWSAPQLAARLGMHPTYVWRLMTHPRRHVALATARKVRDVYGQLWQTPGPWPKARTWAAAHGWVPPMAWDDELIDDPAAQPAPLHEPPGRGRRRAALWEDSEELLAHGVGLEEAAERLGMTSTALHAARHRHKTHLRAAKQAG